MRQACSKDYWFSYDLFVRFVCQVTFSSLCAGYLGYFSLLEKRSNRHGSVHKFIMNAANSALGNRLFIIDESTVNLPILKHFLH